MAFDTVGEQLLSWLFWGFDGPGEVTRYLPVHLPQVRPRSGDVRCAFFPLTLSTRRSTFFSRSTWFWLGFIALISCLVIVFRLATFCSGHFRLMITRLRCSVLGRQDLVDVLSRASIGDWLIIDLLSQWTSIRLTLVSWSSKSKSRPVRTMASQIIRLRFCRRRCRKLVVIKLYTLKSSTTSSIRPIQRGTQPNYTLIYAQLLF